MSKKTIIWTIVGIVFALIVIAVVVGYFYVQRIFNPLAQFGGSFPAAVTPNLNPIEHVNPFKDIYKNPFE